jgi:hypothetical protein
VLSGTRLTEVLVCAADNAKQKLDRDIRFLGSTKFTLAYANVNYEVAVEHTVENISYTMLYVSQQDNIDQGDKSQATFNFRLSSRRTPVHVAMSVGTAVFFSGFFLLYRQSMDDHDGAFFNVSAYCNERMGDNSRNTIVRHLNRTVHGLVFFCKVKVWSFHPGVRG